MNKHYKVRKLLYCNSQPRTAPVEYETFCKELSAFLSHVHYNYVVVLYQKYSELITIGDFNNITSITAIFNLTICSTNNILFHIERGWSREEAAQKVQQRQSTNSISSIMKRKNVSVNEAKNIQLERSQIGLVSKIEHYGGIDSFKESKRKTFNENKKQYYVNQAEILDVSVDKAIKIITTNNAIKGADAKRNDPLYFPNTNIQYYLNQGLTLIEASEQLKKRQTTFSLEICIQKHGNEEGVRVWKARQQKWFETMDAKSDEEKTRILTAKIQNGAFVSQESIRFFLPIINKIPVDLTIFTGDNEYYINDHGKFWKYDFTVLELKIIVEYNGTHVHPKRDSPDNWKHAFNKKSKQEVLLLNDIKRQAAVNKGFTVIDVWNDENLIEKQEYILQMILTKHKEASNDIISL